jgi:hypothetical protein
VKPKEIENEKQCPTVPAPERCFWLCPIEQRKDGGLGQITVDR